jgi:hypothetical protein
VYHRYAVIYSVYGVGVCKIVVSKRLYKKRNYKNIAKLLIYSKSHAKCVCVCVCA